MNNLTLGQKIRNFRKRAGMSQLELELAIGASPGSISRIENGKVNPTKETLLEIAKEVNLTDAQILEIFFLGSFNTKSVSQIINNTHRTNDLNELCQKFADELANNLNYMVVSIFLKEGTDLKANGVSNTQIVKKAYQLLNWKDFKSCPSFNHPKNLLRKSADTGEVFESAEMYDFTIGVVPKSVGMLLKLFSKSKVALSIPIVYGEVVLGSMYIARPLMNTYDYEKEVLLSLGNYLAVKVNEIKLSKGVNT